MMTARAPGVRPLCQIPALPMLSACWTDHPRGPIRAAHRQPRATLSWGKMCPTSRRSNWSYHVALATPVQTRKREGAAPFSHDEAHIYSFKLLAVLFFSMLCFFFFYMRLCKLFFVCLGMFIFFHKFIKIFYHVTHYQSMHHWLFAAWSEPSVLTADLLQIVNKKNKKKTETLVLTSLRHQVVGVDPHQITVKEIYKVELDRSRLILCPILAYHRCIRTSI